GHGWEGAEPWLPWSPHSDVRSVEAARADPSSIVHLYRRLLAVRRSSPALQHGDLDLVDAPDGVLAYRRRAAREDDEAFVLVNFGDAAATVDRGVGRRIAVATTRGDGEGAAFDGTIAGEAAVVLR